MDNAIDKWKILNAEKKLDMESYEQINDEQISKDKITKFLRIFSSPSFYEDWEVAEPEKTSMKNPWWRDFIKKMETFYKPWRYNTKQE